MPRTIIYDLSRDLISWDFLIWIVGVRELGFDTVQFVWSDKNSRHPWFTRDQIVDRVRDIFLPALSMARMKHIITDAPADFRRLGPVHFYQLRPDFRRLHALDEKSFKGIGHTVTLREVHYKQHRNSDRAVWEKFASKIGAHVIEEYAREPISLHKRFALYAGAKMNWGVACGPLGGALMTAYPLSIFCGRTVEQGLTGHHLFSSDQPQFLLPNQRLIWREPTYDILMEEYDKLNELQLDDFSPGMGQLPYQPVCQFCAPVDKRGAAYCAGVRALLGAH